MYVCVSVTANYRYAKKKTGIVLPVCQDNNREKKQQTNRREKKKKVQDRPFLKENFKSEVHHSRNGFCFSEVEIKSKNRPLFYAFLLFYFYLFFVYIFFFFAPYISKPLVSEHTFMTEKFISLWTLRRTHKCTHII